uniref:Uncharacterized protein n=1 Tax=Knipowitschia caucasica TaxID=637954 RepID=A0AAV2KK04_KNICA
MLPPQLQSVRGSHSSSPAVSSPLQHLYFFPAFVFLSSPSPPSTPPPLVPYSSSTSLLTRCPPLSLPHDSTRWFML